MRMRNASHVLWARDRIHDHRYRKMLKTDFHIEKEKGEPPRLSEIITEKRCLQRNVGRKAVELGGRLETTRM